MEKRRKRPVYSALEVARLCGVVNQTAINWINSGHLKAFKTPGGQYRVYPEDLADFMAIRKMQVSQEIAEAAAQKNKNQSIVIIIIVISNYRMCSNGCSCTYININWCFYVRKHWYNRKS